MERQTPKPLASQSSCHEKGTPSIDTPLLQSDHEEDTDTYKANWVTRTLTHNILHDAHFRDFAQRHRISRTGDFLSPCGARLLDWETMKSRHGIHADTSTPTWWRTLEHHALGPRPQNLPTTTLREVHPHFRDTPSDGDTHTHTAHVTHRGGKEHA